MFLNDAVLEPYGAAVFGMSVCATTSLNLLVELGFFAGLALSGFVLIQRFGTIPNRQGRSSSGQLCTSSDTACGYRGLHPPASGGGDIFWFVVGGVHQRLPHLDVQFCSTRARRLSAWSLGCGLCLFFLAIISGGGLLTLLKKVNGGDAYGGVFGLQMIYFLGAAWMTERLDIAGFRSKVRTRLCNVMELNLD